MIFIEIIEIFCGHSCVWDEAAQKWYFAIVDVVTVLADSRDRAAYWRKLKERLKNEGNETVTNCHGFKMTAADGKMRMTDAADTEQLLRLIQSIPPPKISPPTKPLPKQGERWQTTQDVSWNSKLAQK